MRKRKFKRTDIKCHVCGEVATHVVLVELREKPGPALKDNNVLRTVCEEHSKNNDFDYWIPHFAFKKLCDDWSKAGFILQKHFCTILIKPFK